MIWFTSDTHFGHKNIIEYTNRPFKSVEEMDETIINNWNSVVDPKDTIYHLGDFTLKGFVEANKYFSKLNGKIRILKNEFHHDRRWLKECLEDISYFGETRILSRNKNVKELKNYSYVELLPPLYVLEIDQGSKYPLPIILCHYAMAVWDRKHYGSIHLFGHSHGAYKIPNGDKAMDVGVDSNNFYPISLDDVLTRFN